MTSRRDALIGLPLWAAASRGLTQTPSSRRPKRIGVLNVGEESSVPRAERPWVLALAEKGWKLGSDWFYEAANAQWHPDRLAGLAEELVRQRMDIIITGGSAATLAAARATRSIPIVFAGVILPVEQGLIDSYARPGHNLTGQAFYTGIEVSFKRIEFLRKIAPGAERLLWFVDADDLAAPTLDGGSIDVAALLDAAAKGLGFESRFHALRAPQDIDAAFAVSTAWHAQAIILGSSDTYKQQLRHIVETALRQRLASVASYSWLAEAGILLSYGVPATEYAALDIRWVEIINRLLRGASPADIPVERPSRYELVINLKAAKALGLTVPPTVLARADEVIQ